MIGRGGGPSEYLACVGCDAEATGVDQAGRPSCLRCAERGTGYEEGLAYMAQEMVEGVIERACDLGVSDSDIRSVVDRVLGSEES